MSCSQKSFCLVTTYLANDELINVINGQGAQTSLDYDRRCRYVDNLCIGQRVSQNAEVRLQGSPGALWHDPTPAEFQTLPVCVTST